jgi:hypothetical protein
MNESIHPSIHYFSHSLLLFHQEKSEDAALFAEMFIMAQSGGFLGSLNSNFGRTVYELAGGPESGKMLMDIEGRPYFGCEWTSKMPMGGGKRMYPFGH